MEVTLVSLVTQYKKGNKEVFVQICEKMRPLILKYVRILKFDDQEDIRSELVLAMLECLEQIERYSNEQEVLHYINQAIQFRFFELYRSSKKKMNEVNLNNEDTEFVEVIFRYYPNDFEEIIYRQDMKDYIVSLPKNKRNIAKRILLDGMSDGEIAKELHLTRQYIHRVRKGIYTNLQNKYK